MSAQPPLEPDEILTSEGVRVQVRRPVGARGVAPVPAALLALAAAPVVVPVVAAAAACLVGLAGAATGVGVARRLLGAAAPGGGLPGPGVGTLQVTVTQVELRWTYER